MTTTSKASSKTTTKTAASWAQLGLETAADIQKQWRETAVAFSNLAIEGAKHNLEWMENFYGQVRDSSEKAAGARQERWQSLLDRLTS